MHFFFGGEFLASLLGLTLDFGLLIGQQILHEGDGFILLTGWQFRFLTNECLVDSKSRQLSHRLDQILSCFFSFFVRSLYQLLFLLNQSLQFSLLLLLRLRSKRVVQQLKLSPLQSLQLLLQFLNLLNSNLRFLLHNNLLWHLLLLFDHRLRSASQHTWINFLILNLHRLSCFLSLKILSCNFWHGLRWPLVALSELLNSPLNLGFNVVFDLRRLVVLRGLHRNLLSTEAISRKSRAFHWWRLEGDRRLFLHCGLGTCRSGLILATRKLCIQFHLRLGRVRLNGAECRRL